MGPVQVLAEVRGHGRAGAYHVLAVRAPDIAGRVEPGQFVTFAVGGPDTALVLRRAFSVARASPAEGVVEVVVAVAGKGTSWLAGRRPGDRLDTVGPLGRPFALPPAPARAVLVGGGYGAAPLVGLAAALSARGAAVDVVLGAASGPRLFGVEEARRVAERLVCTTEDGSYGVRGRVTDVLAAHLAGADVVYACGPMPMLRAVGAQAAARGIRSQVAVEEAMACGIGVCMTCVLPVVGGDGVTRMVRSCVEGPVFDGDRVRFDDVGTVPVDTYGAVPA